MASTIATFTNHKDGLQSTVKRLRGRFAVTLTDTDAEETLPIIEIRDTLEEAMDYARLCASIPGDPAPELEPWECGLEQYIRQHKSIWE